MPKVAEQQTSRDRREADAREAKQRLGEAVQRAQTIDAELGEMLEEDERERLRLNLLPGQPLVAETRRVKGVPVDARGVPLDMAQQPAVVKRVYRRQDLQKERNALEPLIAQLGAKAREARERAAIELTREQKARLRERAELARVDLEIHRALGWRDSAETQETVARLQRTIEVAEMFGEE